MPLTISLPTNYSSSGTVINNLKATLRDDYSSQQPLHQSEKDLICKFHLQFNSHHVNFRCIKQETIKIRHAGSEAIKFNLAPGCALHPFPEAMAKERKGPIQLSLRPPRRRIQQYFILAGAKCERGHFCAVSQPGINK